MADEDDASKTEDPSDKKLGEARNKGQVAQSQEIKNWAVLLGGTAGLVLLAPWMANNVRILLIPFIQNANAFPMDFEHLRFVFSEVAKEMAIITAPVFAMLFFLAIASNIAQFGLILSGEKIKPEIEKLSLIKGLKRIFSMKSLVEFAKGIFKLLAVGLISFGLAIPFLGDIELLPQLDFLYSLERIHLIAILLAAGTVGVMTIIAALDYIFQRYTFMKEMRMTKQEVKDEQKEQEGDPMIKARIRKIRMDRAQQRMMRAVPEADVVLTNPTHYSVALSYKMEEMAAPKLIAKGVDHLAFKIREIAEAHDVPIVENPPLTRALYAAVELDEEIPPEHFKAVAEVIGFVLRQRGDLPHVAEAG